MPVLLLLLVVALAAHGGWQLLVRSDIFCLTEVSVRGNHHVDERLILEKTGLVQGINLLTFDERAAEERTRNLRWLEDVDIRISWPARVVVQVREYRPLAMVNLETPDGPRLHYLNEKGVVFAPVLPGEDIDFPVLTGETGALVEAGGRVDPDSLVYGALRFLRLAALGNPVLPTQMISEVHIDSGQGLIVYLLDRPFPIYLGRDRIRTQYNRLVKLLGRLYRKKKIDDIKEIHMDYTENRVLVAMNGPVVR